MLKNNFGFRLKYKSKTWLDAFTQRHGGYGIYNLKGDQSQKDRHALIIYTAEALSKYLSGTLSEFTLMGTHSGFAESIELLNTVMDLGYTVDFFSYKDTPLIDWSKYELIIDAGVNLERSKAVNGQKKIYYATGCHWRLFHHNALKHTDSFYRRNGILIYPDRELKSNYCDDAADLITHFGGSYQIASFGANQTKMRQLNISTTYLPLPGKKKIGSRRKFLWYAGYGPFHKGFDLVVEAFLKMPEMELHIFSYIEANERLFKWFLEVTKDCKHIHYHGWTQPESATFQHHMQICDAVVYASSSEGGPGAIIQCMQCGLIPIINAGTAIDLQNPTFNIQGNYPEEEIASIIDRVHAFSRTEVDVLQAYSDELAKEYTERHTLSMYAQSLKKALGGQGS